MAQTGPRKVAPAPPAEESAPRSRAELMEKHRAACRRRDDAALGSAEFGAAAEEVARIEIEIARLEEPPARVPD